MFGQRVFRHSRRAIIALDTGPGEPETMDHRGLGMGDRIADHFGIGFGHQIFSIPRTRR